ncbi:MAG: glycosyltransferase family 2 protein [Verrucomicrobia bacterium]|nr:glycosyltransferase family 2 protein [Verrucomicrobiota bacterium]
MSKKIRPYLSLVIPAFKEAERLPNTLQTVRRYVLKWPFPSEILVVVEPSPDATLPVAEAARRNFPELRVIANAVHRGKGHAVRTGMLEAKGQITFFTDADLSTPLSDLEVALQIFERERQVDVIVGSRQHPESKILQHQSPTREWMGKTFNRIVRLLAGLDLEDTQCGFKGFRQATAREIFSRQRTDGFAFDVEVLLLARMMGFTVREMPVHWSNSAESKVRVIRDSLRMLLEVLAMRRLVNRTVHDYPFYR